MMDVISKFTDTTNRTINDVITDNNGIKRTQENQEMEQRRQNNKLMDLKQLGEVQEGKISKLQQIVTDLQSSKANENEFQTNV